MTKWIKRKIPVFFRDFPIMCIDILLFKNGDGIKHTLPAPPSWVYTGPNNSFPNNRVWEEKNSNFTVKRLGRPTLAPP